MDSIVRARIEAGVERAIGVKSSHVVALCRTSPTATQRCEKTAKKDLPIRLHHDSEDAAVRTRIEGQIDRAVGVETTNVVARSCPSASAEGSEQTANQDLSVRLHR